MYRYHAEYLYLSAGIVWLVWLIWKIFFSKTKLTAKRVVLITLFYAYIMMVFGTTLFPIQNFPLTYPPKYNFIPFSTIKELITTLPATIAIKQIVGNLIMFMPFGFFIPFFTKKNGFQKCIYLSIGFAILIELLQFILGLTFVGSQYRSVDIDDVILNTIGAIVGYIIFKITPHFIKDPYLKTEYIDEGTGNDGTALKQNNISIE